MKVLFIVSECVPFVKSGGLADVAGSLPKELKKLGTDVRVILPKYGTISEDWKNNLKKIAEFRVQVGWRNQYCGIEQLTLDGVTFYFVDNEYYFNRDRLYGFFDDGERFAYFNRAVLESLVHIDFEPDILHCHDWHTGMVPFLLRVDYRHRKRYVPIKTVFTIHNLQFQGIFPKEILGDLLNLSEKFFNSEQLEFYGNVNFMKGALVASDKITTVSPTYMQEIQTPYFGEKLDGLLRKRRKDLQGILNGIDERFYNPEKDPFIFAPYHKNDISGKTENKKRIQELFGLRQEADTPIIAMITRLTKQKGLDLVKCVFHELMAENLQMIVLGTGEDEFENFFREMAYHYPEKFKVYIGFNEELAHQIYAGSDLFLMPSKFEPCGLGQLIAMKYGSIPIVRETGGLNDTVVSYREDNGEGNGFSFSNFNAHDMLYTIRRALQFYKDDNVWKKLVKRAMGLDYSWAQSAFKYNSLYAELISRSESHVY
ncbi:glycogen synthase GlgA [Bacillus methanolicus]|uniref:Glycogen synthase n=1 Tax=Bacillus methanolicus (strain MGA3 / ATCC 53907) TaxID=796606 RepID=I3EC71_BACMM|nr:glycogen synthase GlgA [Bacillus methanolicus]AIE61134.1 Glycogen synthase [Bacillus methanolicus MGA3]EIJ84092.1 glycogen synthase [Bacillus methanolicus MGA3]